MAYDKTFCCATKPTLALPCMLDPLMHMKHWQIEEPGDYNGTVLGTVKVDLNYYTYPDTVNG